jgi:L-ascorbate metabolism protein UlaG (beta-lactamase superfamily)
VLHLDLPFDHPAIDELARMKRRPRPLRQIQQMLGISPAKLPLFETLFTESPPPPYERYTGDKIRMRYFGHACVLIETRDVSILVDPLISYYGYRSDVAHYSDMDLPDEIDHVLITHNHQDHVLFETLLPLRHRVKNFLVPRACGGKLEDPNLKLMLDHIGFSGVREIGELETIELGEAGEVSVTGIPFVGEHGDLQIQTKTCYLLQLGSFRMLFVADSKIVEPALYKHVHSYIGGDLDVLFLGMECDGAPMSWLYGPLMTRKLTREQDGGRRLAGSNCERGARLVDIFRPREVYVYAMGQEPWLTFISSIQYTEASSPIVQSSRLVALCRDKGLVAERLYGEKELLYEMRSSAGGSQRGGARSAR